MAQGTPTKVKKRKKSVLKKARHDVVRAAMNRANRTRLRSAIKRMRAAIDSGNATEAGQLLRPTMSAIDKAISKGILHENTGNRYKSRLTVAAAGIKQ